MDVLSLKVTKKSVCVSKTYIIHVKVRPNFFTKCYHNLEVKEKSVSQKEKKGKLYVFYRMIEETSEKVMSVRLSFKV